MNRCRHTVRLGILAGALLLMPALFAPADAPKDPLAAVKKARGRYQGKLESLQAVTKKTLDRLNLSYLRGVTALKDHYRGEGDIEGLSAASDELSRFEEQRTVTPDDVVQGPDRLTAMQRKYLEGLGAIHAEAAETALPLYEAYTRYLRGMTGRLSEADHADALDLVRRELDATTGAIKLARARLPAPAPRQPDPAPVKTETPAKKDEPPAADVPGITRLEKIRPVGTEIWIYAVKDGYPAAYTEFLFVDDETSGSVACKAGTDGKATLRSPPGATYEVMVISEDLASQHVKGVTPGSAWRFELRPATAESGVLRMGSGTVTVPGVGNFDVNHQYQGGSHYYFQLIAKTAGTTFGRGVASDTQIYVSNSTPFEIARGDARVSATIRRVGDSGNFIMEYHSIK